VIRPTLEEFEAVLVSLSPAGAGGSASPPESLHPVSAH
jgi:hypothetical protein